MSSKRPVIEGKRRRPGGSSAPAGRAEAPARRRPQAGGSGGASSGGISGSSGGGTSGSGSFGQPPTSGGGTIRPTSLGGLPRNLSAGCVIGLLVIAFLLYQFLGGSNQGADLPGDVPGDTPGVGFNQTEEFDLPTEPPARPTATRQPRPTRSPAPAGSGATGAGDTWTIMLYLDADDKILEQDIYLDLNEAERVGSTENVRVLAQIDRFRGGFQGDGDWVSARRYFVTQDDDLQRVGSAVLEELGEVNMADADTLVDFVTWGIQNYPADKYALILSDHGLGWPGGWSDATSRGGDGSLPLARVLGGQIYLHELDAALEEIRSQAGLDKFELIGMDACLMGHLEVFTALAPHARFAAASQETEPALGWAYYAFLTALNEDPAMSGGDLGKRIVDSYIYDDQRIVDDQERANLVGRGSLLNSLFGEVQIPSPEQVSSQMSQNVTLAAIDLSVLPELLERFNDLAYTLQEANQRDIAQARSNAQSYTSIFGTQVPPSYFDLGHFAQLAGRISGRRSIGEASNGLLEVLGRAVVEERHGRKRPGSSGISIYFPNSALYGSAEAGPRSYTVTARRFADESLWDEFLAFHYTNRPFERGDRLVTVPERGVAIEAPAAGGIQLTTPEASADSVEPGESIRLTSDIRGANIGYIRLLAGYLDEANNSIYMIDSDYIESGDTQELNGVYYPVWGAEEFTLAFEWEPIVFAIHDGTNSAVALFNPESYGASPEEAVYSVEGTYTYASDGEQRYARLYFSNGQLQQVFGFTGEDAAGATGAPREIIPQQGDTFTILERWLDLDGQGNVTQQARQAGETLTFGDAMFTWEQLYAAPGEYIVGFLVEDLDGNSKTAFVRVRVE